MQCAPLPLVMALAAASLIVTTAASAQSVRLQYGMPLGSFTATPSGQQPRTHAPKATVTRHTPNERRTPTVAAEAATETTGVRGHAASQEPAKPVETPHTLEKAETTTEADAPTAVASQENKTCRKFIATAGTTIEVPCAAASD